MKAKSGKKIPSCLTLDELEHRIIAALDYHETIARPLDATEKRAFARLEDEFNKQPIRDECARLKQDRREYIDGLYVSMRRMLAPDPKRREYSTMDTDAVLDDRKRRNGDKILFNRKRISIGLAEPLDYNDLADAARKALDEAQMIMRELRLVGVVLVDAAPVIGRLGRYVKPLPVEDGYVPLFQA